MTQNAKLKDDDYWRLLEFRTAIRGFLNYSKTQAEKHGLTPTQHQLLLAIRGHRPKTGPTIGEVAERLLIKHHSAVELVNRAEAAALVRRHQDRYDQRVVRLTLTRAGAAKLERISRANLAEIGRLGPQFQDVWQAIERLSVEAPAGLSTRSPGIATS
ncbi:MAG: MarR family transcriptional regulator [Actinomycetota bacterium]|nr:MarR family transcriptional regulator [Actinomycetota bacterium]